MSSERPVPLIDEVILIPGSCGDPVPADPDAGDGVAFDVGDPEATIEVKPPVDELDTILEEVFADPQDDKVPETTWASMLEFVRFDKKTANFHLSRKTKGPPEEAIFARTTIDLMNHNVIEGRRLLSDMSEDERLGPLPCNGRRK